MNNISYDSKILTDCVTITDQTTLKKKTAGICFEISNRNSEIIKICESLFSVTNERIGELKTVLGHISTTTMGSTVADNVDNALELLNFQAAIIHDLAEFVGVDK